MTSHLHHQRMGSVALICPSLPENTSLETEKWQRLRFAHTDNYNILERYPFTLLCQRVTKGTLYTTEDNRSLGIVDSSRSLGTVYSTDSHMAPDPTVVWVSCRTRWPKHKAELSQNIVLFKDREENGWNLDLYTWGLYWALTLNLTKVGHVF